METVITDDELACTDNDVFTWKGKDYACAAESSSEAHGNIDVGIVLLPTIALNVRTALFNNEKVPTRAEYQILLNAGGVPKTHDEVIYDGKLLHVKTAERSVDNLSLNITLESYMAGATHG